MDIKRNIFLILSTIAFILPFVVTSLSDKSFRQIEIELGFLAYIFVPIIFYLCYLLVHLFGTLIIGSSNYNRELDDDCIFLLGVLLFRQKRIYYSDLGYFYLSGKETITIWKQGFFSSKKLFDVHYNGNLDNLRTQIKSDLEKIYKKELEEKRRFKTLKDWNGCIDKQSERDDILNKILK
jgi:hypothetical protein